MTVNPEQATAALDYFANLWRVLFPPAVPVPDKTQFGVWLVRYEPRQIERAIEVTATKHLAVKGNMDADHIGRYISGVLRNINEQAHQRQHSHEAAPFRFQLKPGTLNRNRV
jgi:hypothetical protein